jgi:pimeloyl-ACP methyl ester carboxylesterase
MSWHFVQQGKGRPLVLLHGIGMSHAAWNPVLPFLARERRVIAFDIAGFGQTPPLADGISPTAENITRALAQTLRKMDIHEPVDIAGNSLGGYLALEAAKQGVARSVVALSPAGLWKKDGAPGHIKAVFGMMRSAIHTMPRLSNWLVGFAPTRVALMAVPLSSQAWRMSSHDALVATRNFANAAAFDETRDAVSHFVGGQDIKVPVTVAFGSRDWLLTADCQNRDELPRHTRWHKPRGWGHVPMWDDPSAVARLILEGTV